MVEALTAGMAKARFWRDAVTASLILLASPASAGGSSLIPVDQTFDLICSGTVEHSGPLKHETEPYAMRYRVDLGRNRWCSGECKFTEDIAKVMEDRLILRSTELVEPANVYSKSEVVFRDTGRHSVIVQNVPRGSYAYATSSSYAGNCEKAPFSGFPVIPTKF